MATDTEISEVYVGRLNRESAQLEAETRRLMAEANKLQAERSIVMARQTWLDKPVFGSPTLFFAFILILAIAIMGLGAGLARLFLR